MLAPPDFMYWLHPVPLFFTILFIVGAVAFAIYSLLLLPPVRRASTGLIKINTAVGSISGGVFGLSLAFLAHSVYSMEDRARDAVNAEAHAVQGMTTALDVMTGPSRDGLVRLLEHDGTSVADEWSVMVEGGSETEQSLRDIYSAIIDWPTEEYKDKVQQNRLLAEFDNLSNARQERLSIAQDRVSGGQWALVEGLIITLLFVVAMSHADFRIAARVSLGAIATAASLLLFVIIMHDRPFFGYGALGPDPILAASGDSP